MVIVAALASRAIEQRITMEANAPPNGAAHIGAHVMATRYIAFPQDMRRSAVQGIKLYMFAVADLGGACFWELRHVFEPLWNKPQSNAPISHRWWKNVRHTYLEDNFEALGLDNNHERRSVRQARAAGMDDADLARCTPEITASTAVVMATLAIFAAGFKLKVDRLQSLLILTDLLQSVSGGNLGLSDLAWPGEATEVPEVPPLCASRGGSRRRVPSCV